MIWDSHNITPYIGFILMTMSISFVYSYIYKKSQGNLLVMVLFHGSNNAAHALFYLFYNELPASAQCIYWIYVAMNILAALIVIILRLIRKRKLKNEKTSTMDEK